MLAGGISPIFSAGTGSSRQSPSVGSSTSSRCGCFRRRRDRERPSNRLRGAITVTGSLMLASTRSSTEEKGWGSGQTLGLLVAAGALLALFLVIESRVSSPLMNWAFQNRNVSTAKRRRRADGRRPVLPTSSLRLYMSWCSSTPHSGRSGVPAGNDHLGSVLAPALGKARHALRDQAHRC